jgi:serine/threonine-protein kinase
MPMATAAAPLPHRSKAPIVAFAAVACLLLVGVGFVLFTGSGGDDAAPGSRSGDAEALDDEDPSEEDAPVATETPDSTDVGASGSVATIPVEVVPTTTVPPPETTAPPLPVDTTTPPPVVIPGDLGLAQPMTRPPCDDTYITVLISSLDPATDATAVSDALTRYPGSAYLKTIETCPSLRPSVNGAEIYVVYFGPFLTEAEACAARASGPSDAYVRTLSVTVPDTHRIAC